MSRKSISGKRTSLGPIELVSPAVYSSSPLYIYCFENVTFGGVTPIKTSHRRDPQYLRQFPEYIGEGMSYPPKKKGARFADTPVGYPICPEILRGLTLDKARLLSRWILGFDSLETEWILLFPYWLAIDLENKCTRAIRQQPEIDHNSPYLFLKECDPYFQLPKFHPSNPTSGLHFQTIYIYPQILETIPDKDDAHMPRYVQVPDIFSVVRDSEMRPPNEPRPYKPLWSGRYYDALGNHFFRRITYEKAYAYRKARDYLDREGYTLSLEQVQDIFKHSKP